MDQFDLIVIGSGPSGQRAAVQAAKIGKKVLVVERHRMGGNCLHFGTIPSKTLREAALSGLGYASDAFHMAMARKNQVVEEEQKVIQTQLDRNHVKSITGKAKFLSAHEIEIQPDSGEPTRARGSFIIVATGTRPFWPANIEFDDKHIVDSDSVLNLVDKPRTLAVLGAGVIGAEYASIFASLGVRVTLIDQKSQLFGWMDAEISDALKRHFEKHPFMELRLGVAIGPIQKQKRGVQISLGEEQRQFDVALVCLGRSGNIEELALPTIGLKANERGLIPVNEHYQTSIPHIYAVGDVIGSPGLASASAEQGRIASAHAFGVASFRFPDSFPYGIYTIPEISTVGALENDLKKKNIPYVVGRAKYSEIARGKILGDDSGFLKLLFHSKTRQLLGVQILGTGATELVHIGQVAYMLGGGIDFFVGNVFNYPTLAEAYKVAAYHALNQLRTGT